MYAYLTQVKQSNICYYAVLPIGVKILNVDGVPKCHKQTAATAQ